MEIHNHAPANHYSTTCDYSPPFRCCNPSTEYHFCPEPIEVM